MSTPFEIALAVRNDHDADQEELQVFMLRRFAKEKMTSVGDALDLLIAWERAYEEFEGLLDCLKKVKRQPDSDTIDTLIKRRRQLGYDAKFEAILARQWRCPHCKQFATISEIEIPIGDQSRLPRCITCGEEGIAPIDGKPSLKTRDGGKSGLRPV